MPPPSRTSCPDHTLRTAGVARSGTAASAGGPVWRSTIGCRGERTKAGGYRTSMGETRRLTIMLSGGLGDCLLASAFVRYLQESGRYDHIRCAVPKSAAE